MCYDFQDSLHSDQVKNTLIKTTSSKDLKICNQKDITAEEPGSSSSYSDTDVLDSQNKGNPCNTCLTVKPPAIMALQTARDLVKDCVLCLACVICLANV